MFSCSFTVFFVNVWKFQFLVQMAMCSSSLIYYLEFISGSVEIELMSFLVVQAAITRSAHIPFSSCLPAAMAARSPVSALVPSSTLVTAGVYLLIRFRPCFNYWLNVILLLVSGLTIFIAGLGANFEFDLKRIIALSTVRQLVHVFWFYKFLPFISMDIYRVSHSLPNPVFL